MPRSYRLHELSYSEFEELCGRICISWLGEGFTTFAPGRDGGRDGKFFGTANTFPSESEPLVGHVVAQAKHTSVDGRSCSDKEFERLLKDEHSKISKLIEEGLCDHYVVFTNRRLTGGTEKKFIAELERLGLTSAHIVGTERLKMALDTMRDLRESLPNRSDTLPFHFDDGEMAAVVKAFNNYVSDDPQSAFDSATDFEKIPIKKKNTLNGLSEDYYTQVIRVDSMPHFERLEAFLRNPRNQSFAERYYDSADELKQKIIVERARFDTFDHVLLFIIERVQKSNPALRGRRKLVSILTHYMYVNCDIGKKSEAEVDAAGKKAY
ncbi:ABC-three component system protein [Martelella lutilitoris]|uniref:ABC-three component system protein n=1 Tax=Martelella lutilitoris TaxID=2583532 RepID=UPI0016517ACF|nr:ABC-three component system protein [Martelella lutilitoris]